MNYTAVSDLGITTALASTEAFGSVRRHGTIFAPANRDATIFPQKVGGQYAAFHRPMPTYIGDDSVWYAASPVGIITNSLPQWGY